MKEKPNLLIFDVNETLLDMEPIQSDINESLGSKNAFNLWFSKLLEYSSAETLTGNYLDFGKVGLKTLMMTAKILSVDLSEEKAKKILGKITKLAVHQEVPAALKSLKKAGFTLVALTNGGIKTVEEQLKCAEIYDLFDAVYSVEAVKKFKPHPEPYEYVLQQQNKEPEQAMLIAAHAWDILGAQRVGLQTGFISRPGKFLYAVEDKPTVEASTLQDIAKALLNPVM